MGSREYTERLALQFSQLQLDWRERAEQLQRELLRTRQELTRFQIQAETLNQTHPHFAGGTQWSDSDWQSSGYSSSVQVTSQEGEQLTGTEEPAASVRENSRTERIAAHIKFLSSVSSVLSTRRSLSVLTESDLRTAVRDTIVQATRGLSEVLEASSLPVLPPSLSSLQSVVQTIVEATQAPRMQLFHAEMVEACDSLLKTVTSRISSHQDTESQSEVLCSLVCILSSMPTLYCHAVQHLISAVLACAEMLLRSTQDIGLLDVGAVESASVVFRTLEALFTKYDTSTLPQQLCSRLSGELENSILEITATYPLFVFSVWRVLAHMAPTSR
jgi:hypothetical protein